MKNELFGGAMIILAACGGASTASSHAPSTAAEAPASESHANHAAGGSAACEELATVCHGHDEANPLVAECHMVGHNADAHACEARHHECMAACQQAAAEHPHAAE